MFSILAHASDRHSYSLRSDSGAVNLIGDGYAPNIPGICRDDETNITVCIACGMLQGYKPLRPAQAVEILYERPNQIGEDH